MRSNSAGSSCRASIYTCGSTLPPLNMNWWDGMANSGLIYSRSPSSMPSSTFWVASTTALSFFLARLDALRIYSTAVRLVKNR